MRRVLGNIFQRITLIGPVALWFIGAAQASDPSCFTCHGTQLKLHTASAHAAAGLSCVDCHGGNPKDAEITAHDTPNFQKPENKKAVAEFCASCHSDVRKMNPYGLPTDQLARYKTSKHGEQLFGKGDKNVAVCVDCHGVHDIMKASSPQSRTHPTHIPETCGRCHSDEKLMSQYKLPADVVAQYKTSHHAHLVLEKGDLSAPTCITCHGNHGATPPGTAEVGQVCGKCHVRQRELFAKSPHAEAAKAGLFNECVSCHGNHAIKKASVDLYSKACIQCHEGDKKQMGVCDSLDRLIRGAQASYEGAKKLVHDATVRGLATDDEQLVLQEVKTQVTQLEALQHTLSLADLQPVAARSEELVNMIRADVAQLEKVERWKRRALLPAWGFLVIMAALFYWKRKQVER